MMEKEMREANAVWLVVLHGPDEEKTMLI